MNNTNTILLMSEPPNNFQVKNIVLKINKGKKQLRITPIYIQGILYPKKTT